MSLKEDIELIISKDVEEVVNTSLVLTLLKVYSILYLGGSQPRACGQCQRGYYAEIKSNGLKKLEIMKDSIERTCELKTNNLIYISALHNHVSNINITDQMAIQCLKNGWLKEADFAKLPIEAKVTTHKDVLESVVTVSNEKEIVKKH